MSGSWLDSLGGTLADYATTAMAAGDAAASELAAHITGALTRVQALPAEAASAVAELNTALLALLPDPAVPSRHGASSAALHDISGGACAGQSGQAGVISGTIVPRPQGPLPRRMVIDSAGLARFLRARHPERTAESAAALTRLPVETVAKILARQSLGNGRTLLAFVFAYGPDVLAAAVPGADQRWLEGARILADQARLEAEIARTRAEAAANAGRWSLCGIGFGGAA